MNLFERLFPAGRLARAAVRFENRTLTYGDLRDETLRIVEVLVGLGVQPGDRVAILLADSPEFVAAFVGIISAGAIAVPINPALRREEQLFILQDCGARVVIIEARSAGPLLENSSLTELKDVLAVSRDAGATLPEIEGLRALDFATAPATVSDEFASGATQASDTKADAFILYTSGSTGEPKGAVHTQADIFYTNETYCREVLKLREGDRLFSSSRLPFAYGLGNSFSFPLLNGLTTILCADKPVPAVVGRVFNEERPTIFFAVPVVYRMLLEHHRNAAPLDCASLRLCISAGEALPAQLGEEWERTFGVEVLDGIGSTEMLHMFMSNHAGEARYGSSGQLLNGYQAKLIDHEGSPVAAGEVGNLWISGDSSASRYWQRPEISRETFLEGWTRTGDLYRCDPDGFWWHMGRSDDCFKPTGQWVSPVEIENVLLRHESTVAAAVVEGFDKDRLSCVCAFVVLGAGNDATIAEDELRRHCEDSLPRFKQPRRYLFVSDLPYTATGKVQRFKLREQLRQDLPD